MNECPRCDSKTFVHRYPGERSCLACGATAAPQAVPRPSRWELAKDSRVDTQLTNKVSERELRPKRLSFKDVQKTPTERTFGRIPAPTGKPASKLAPESTHSHFKRSEGLAPPRKSKVPRPVKPAAGGAHVGPLPLPALDPALAALRKVDTYRRKSYFGFGEPKSPGFGGKRSRGFN